MRIQADEASLSRMLGVSVDEIPVTVLVEYELRLQMFHSDGHSGPLGTIGIIDLLRGMKLGPKLREDKPVELDWSRVPGDGTVRVEAKLLSPEGIGYDWVPGVYLGRVGVGSLAVRLDGDAYVHELRRMDVRIAREKPPEAAIIPLEEAGMPELPEAILALKAGDSILVDLVDGAREATFREIRGRKVMALVKGEKKPRSFNSDGVTIIAGTEAVAVASGE